MKATYGSYDHDDQPVLITEFRDVSEMRDGKVYRVVRNISLEWEVRGDTQADLTTKITALHDAYSLQGKNFVLLQDDAAESAHILKTGGVTQDISVVDFGFSESKGVEYVNRRTATASLRGTVQFTANATSGGGGGDLYRYEDSLTAIGDGGARVVYRELPSGVPVAHTIATSTLRLMRQSGAAESTSGFVFAAPVGSGILNPSRSQTKIGPVYRRGRYVYITRWNYQFAGGDYSANNPTTQQPPP